MFDYRNLPRVFAVVIFCWTQTAFGQLGQSPGIDRFYVSPSGNDTWSGRLAGPDSKGNDGPFATLGRAKRAIGEIRRTGLEKPIEVIVDAGTYYLAEPLVLSSSESGTAECPVTFRAAEKGRAILSGGRPITGWQRETGDVWSAESADDMREVRILRVGEEWAIRARYPNFDAENPRTGGWLFADWHGETWEKGAFGRAVQNTHNVGDRLVWNVVIPAEGRYRVWTRYGQHNLKYGIEDMDGRSALQVDDATPVPLLDLPDTGAWGNFRWSHSADLELNEGEHRLTWTNLEGGGLSLDAFVLCDDESWDPEDAITGYAWWGKVNVAPPAHGKHLVQIQAEACDLTEGPEISVPGGIPPGGKVFMRFMPNSLPEWGDLSGAEVHIFPAWGWVSAIVPVERVDYTERKIFFAGGGAAQDVRMGNRYYLANLARALDAPGEWCTGPEEGRISYIPKREQFPDLPVTAAVLDRLIVIEGDPDSEEPLGHIRFEGFAFTDTTYTLTDQYYTPKDAAIWISGATDCEMKHCEFRWLGGYALRLENRSRGIRFIGNNVHHMGQGGAILLGDNESQPRHNLFAGNVMKHLGLVYKHVAAVYVTTGSDNRIAHNTVSDTPRYGFALKSYDGDSASLRNVVEFNDIRRTNLETNDTGAIETLGRSRENTANIIRYNLILDSVGLGTGPHGEMKTPYFSWGIYLDDYSSGTTVRGNIVARTDYGSICVHGGKDNVFDNNIFLDGNVHQIRLQPRDDFMRGNRFTRNILVYSRVESDLIYSWSWPEGESLFSEWDRNLYWLRGAGAKTADLAKTPLGVLAEWREAGFDGHSIVADPMFVDAETDDYRLSDGSPAHRLGFERIPVERIGVRGWNGVAARFQD